MILNYEIKCTTFEINWSKQKLLVYNDHKIIEGNEIKILYVEC